MACLDPTNVEWTIQMVTHPNPSHPPVDKTLVFCLGPESLGGGDFSGEVFEGIGGPLLSQVTGTTKRIPVTGQRIMTLSFTWSPVKIFLAAHIHQQGPETLFDGGFIASSSFDALVDIVRKVKEGTAELETLMGPGDGETGTGTGQQT